MKPDLQQHLAASASREKRDIWDQFRHDHELIERLRITPHELDSLGKCALLGTLTCKQDLLFILRQIREATGSSSPPTVFASAPTSNYEETIDQRAPDLSRIRVRLAPSAETLSQPASLAGITQRRVPEQFGVLFWAVILAAGLVWNLAIAASRWRVSLRTTMLGTPAVPEAAQSHAWYAKFDDFHLLIVAEILFVLCVLAVIFVRGLRNRPRRLKVRPL
jgi:hypothetical protein